MNITPCVWLKILQSLCIIKFYIIVILLIEHRQFVSGSLSLNQNIEHGPIQKYVESNICLGSWCLYVKNCIQKENIANYDNYMNGICKLLIVELNHVLTTASYLHDFNTNEKVTTSSNLQDEIKEIQLRYMEHIFDYQDNYERTINHHRSRRYAEKTKIDRKLIGVPFHFFRDIIRHCGLSDITFVFEEEQLKQNKYHDLHMSQLV
jgi:hypothetical protein